MNNFYTRKELRAHLRAYFGQIDYKIPWDIKWALGQLEESWRYGESWHYDKIHRKYNLGDRLDAKGNQDAAALDALNERINWYWGQAYGYDFPLGAATANIDAPPGRHKPAVVRFKYCGCMWSCDHD